MAEGLSFIRDLAVILLAATGGGWLARRLGLSAVVGYLAAGMLVGTPEVTFVYVSDPAQIELISQIGLIFLLFSIGLGIRIRRIRELGSGPLVATILTALLMLTLTRFVASLIGLSPEAGLFLAAMLMNSSSAVIGKVLSERQLLHQRPGQMALSQTLLEDFVAVAMMTFLGSLVLHGQAPQSGGAAVLQSIGKLAAFVLFFVITGLLLLPVLMERIRRHGGPELLVILVGALLFALALLAVQAGYSLALGAFLCGVLVAESPRSAFVEKAFSGMRDIFTAVFFVAIGMSVDLGLTLTALDLIGVGLALALVGRALSATLAWLIACETVPNALRAALTLTPIGEFSLIIAGMGVAGGMLDERFQVAAVGLAFITSIAAPVLMVHSGRLAGAVARVHGGWIAEFGAAYRKLLGALGRRGAQHILWRFLRKRFWQIGRELVWMIAILVFAHPVYGWLQLRVAGRGEAWAEAFLPLFWLGLLLVLLVPLVSILRNVQAVAMIVVDYLGRQNARVHRWRNPWTLFLQLGGSLPVFLLLANFLPWTLVEWWLLLLFLLLGVLLTALGWRRFIRLHSEMEFALQGVLESPDLDVESAWSDAQRDWGLVLEEVTLPDPFAFAGRTIAQLALRQRTGATVVSVERQGVPLDQPGPQTHLFPGDRVFLLGNPEQTRAAAELLRQESAAVGSGAGWERAVLEAVHIPEGSPCVGKSLAALNWPRLHGVMVAAARLPDGATFTPGADWRLQANAEILLAGPPKAIGEIKARLAEGAS